MFKKYLLLATLLVFFLASIASAYTITSQLTGDIRSENPDGIVVDVTINVDESADTASWLVDLNSPIAHPTMKLDAFYFNLDVTTTQANLIVFDAFTPTGWGLTYLPNNTQGVGGVTFEYSVDNNTVSDVTNGTSLTFLMTTPFDLISTVFTNATVAVSNDAGSGQLGAHLSSLGADGNDSGFAFGVYYEVPGGGGGGDPDPVPEPSTLILLGIGIAGLAAYRRKKN